MTNLAQRPRVRGANHVDMGFCSDLDQRMSAVGWLRRRQKIASFRRSPHMSFAAASDCRTNTIYEHTPRQRMLRDQFKSVRGV
jgi:hypothetical protein